MSSQLPPQQVTIRDIPPEKVEAMTESHKAMGADKIEVIKQSNGRFSMKVTYAD
ncbi:MAG: hypothetical protein QOH32_3211 [Bradyrhizobium sp.]|jgi:hypothetical protein|nr:hypothetical protein [Bradyrhizobium sp.]